VAVVALLMDGTDPEVSLGTTAADRLTALGVTNVALFRDRDGVCVVLEGWAFDVARSSDAAIAAIGASGAVRTLRPVMQTALRAGSNKEI
jgi:hypothetical protein